LFRENNNHLQQSLFESVNFMDSRIKAKLEKGSVNNFVYLN